MCRWRPPSADRGRRRGRTWHAPSAGQGGGATCPFFRSPSKLRRIAQRKGAAAAGEEVLVQGGAGLAVIGDILRVGDRKSPRSELQSLMRISYAVFCLKNNTTLNQTHSFTTALEQQVQS